jgi:hypothetical protein
MISALVLAGCSHVVLVQDMTGAPIEGAQVTAQSLSSDHRFGSTGEDGRLDLNGVDPQTHRTLVVSKPGYHSV